MGHSKISVHILSCGLSLSQTFLAILKSPYLTITKVEIGRKEYQVKSYVSKTLSKCEPKKRAYCI